MSRAMCRKILNEEDAILSSIVSHSNQHIHIYPSLSDTVSERKYILYDFSVTSVSTVFKKHKFHVSYCDYVLRF